MPRRGDGGVTRKDTRHHGESFAARFRVKGDRKFKHLGYEDEGWTLARAEAELRRIVESVRDGTYVEDPDTFPEAQDLLRAEWEREPTADPTEIGQRARELVHPMIRAELEDRHWRGLALDMLRVGRNRAAVDEDIAIHDCRVRLPNGRVERLGALGHDELVALRDDRYKRAADHLARGDEWAALEAARAEANARTLDDLTPDELRRLLRGGGDHGEFLRLAA